MNTTRTELISSLIANLLPTSPLVMSEAELSQLSPNDQRVLLRALMNLWQPGPLDADFRRRQDALLQAERDERGIVTIQDTQAAAEDPRIRLWQGDITRLATDGIVNAANNKLLGCFRPGHACVDNAIHSAAGLQLRQACAELVPSPDYEEPTGSAQITPGFNLPARYVLHTVGPIVAGREANRQQVAELSASYTSCLNLAHSSGLKSLAFCCISTGVFGFPPSHAARIAVTAARAFLAGLSEDTDFTIIFTVFTQDDYDRYTQLLNPQTHRNDR